MLSVWANHVVLAGLGLGIGMVAATSLIVAPPSFSEALRRKPGEGFFEGVKRGSREQGTILRNSPGLVRVSVALWALLAVLVLVVVAGPVELRWGTYFSGVVAGFAAVQVTFHLKRGRARPEGEGRSLLDPLAGARGKD